jgi:cell division protein FtsW (lipid II flippase)
MNRKYDILPALFWIGLSTFAMIGAYKLELGEFHDPGAGLMPFLLAALLFLTAIPVVIRSISGLMKNQLAEKKEPGKIDLTRIIAVAVALFAYCFFLPKLGYLIATVLLLLLLFKIANPKKWWVVIIAALITTLVSYYGFGALGLRFPRGILGV